MTPPPSETWRAAFVRRFLWTILRLSSSTGRWMSRWWLLVAGAVLLTVVLAAIGFYQLAAAEPGLDMDPLTAAWGVLAVFAVQGELEPVPLSLAVARVAAPVTTATVLLAAVLAFSRTRLHRSFARRARGHLVLLGPHDRIDAWAEPTHQTDRTAVHLDTGPPVAQRVDVRVAVALDPFSYEGDRWDPTNLRSPDSWVDASGATASTRSVIATGRDHWNLAALQAALEQQMPRSDQRLVVEIRNRSTALRLAVHLATCAPHLDIDVVCRDDVLARLAAEHLVAHLRRHEGDPGDLRLGVVGDDPITRLVAHHLERQVFDLVASDVPGIDLHVIGSDAETAEWYRSSLRYQEIFRIVHHDRLAGFLGSPWPGAGSLVYVAHRDPERTAREAFEVAVANPANRVFAAMGPTRLPMAAAGQVTSLDSHEVLDDRELVGPWHTVAERLFDRPPEAEDVHAVRVAVRRLATHLPGPKGTIPGTTWSIAPTSSVGRGAAAIPLGRHQDRAASADSEPVGAVLLRDPHALGAEQVELLPSALAEVGLALVAHRRGSGTTDRTGDATRVPNGNEGAQPP